MRCASCHIALPIDAIFCLRCGARQTAAPPSDAPALNVATGDVAIPMPEAGNGGDTSGPDDPSPVGSAGSADAISRADFDDPSPPWLAITRSEASTPPAASGVQPRTSNDNRPAQWVFGSGRPSDTPPSSAPVRPTASPRPTYSLPVQPAPQPSYWSDVRHPFRDFTGADLLAQAVMTVGLFCLWFLPAATSETAFGHLSASFSQIVDGLRSEGDAWVVYLAAAGCLLLGYGASKRARRTQESGTQALLIIIGTAMMLVFPLKMYLVIKNAMPEAINTGMATSASLGSGLKLGTIALIIAAGIALTAVREI